MANKKQYGLLVVGRVRVFRKDKEIKGKNKKKYQITDVWFNVSEKEEDGSWFNKPMKLLFAKGLDKPENNTIINIQDAFPVITGSGDYRQIALFVRKYVEDKE